MLQVEGAGGLATLRAKIDAGGMRVLYHGSLGLFASAFLGHCESAPGQVPAQAQPRPHRHARA
eukprot:4109450-Pleurochrysis_carterae.AAC.1